MMKLTFLICSCVQCIFILNLAKSEALPLGPEDSPTKFTRNEIYQILSALDVAHDIAFLAFKDAQEKQNSQDFKESQDVREEIILRDILKHRLW